MEVRHLRCFLAVAEELHFARAAERLHIEQSPLSRAIKELEEDLGVRLFIRTTRSTRLSRAGQVFKEHVPRIFTTLQQAREGAKAVAAGYDGQLRIALSDGITPPRLSAFLAKCRDDDPEVGIHLAEIPLTQQIAGLREDLYDAGFAQSDDVDDGLLAVPAWHDPLVVAVPAKHPLLTHKRIPLQEVLRYPLAMGDPHACEGYCRQNARVLRTMDVEPLVAEEVASLDLMLTLVSAGYALALVGASQIAACRSPDVTSRPLAGHVARPDNLPAAGRHGAFRTTGAFHRTRHFGRCGPAPLIHFSIFTALRLSRSKASCFVGGTPQSPYPCDLTHLDGTVPYSARAVPTPCADRLSSR